MKRFILILFVLSLLFFVKVKLFSSKQLEEKSYEIESFEVLPETEITLLEAYRFGIETAKKYNEESELIMLNSVDDEKVSGNDGKKANWQGIISLPNKDRRVIFVIEKGKLKSYHIIDGSKELTISDSEIKIDSNQIVNQAAEEFGLEPREDHFSNGYHFRILRDEKNIFIAVDGRIDGMAVEIITIQERGGIWEEWKTQVVESKLDGEYPFREKSIVRCKCLYTKVGDIFFKGDIARGSPVVTSK